MFKDSIAKFISQQQADSGLCRECRRCCEGSRSGTLVAQGPARLVGERELFNSVKLLFALLPLAQLRHVGYTIQCTMGNGHFDVFLYLHENLPRQLGNGGQKRQPHSHCEGTKAGPSNVSHSGGNTRDTCSGQIPVPVLQTNSPLLAIFFIHSTKIYSATTSYQTVICSLCILFY